MAESFVERGAYLKAIEEYSKIVNLEQSSNLRIRAQKEVGRIYKDHLQDYPRAIRSYRNLYHWTSDLEVRSEARLEIAKIYSEKLNQFEDAAKEYKILYEEWARKREKEGPQVLMALSQSLMDAGLYAQAAERFSEFRKKYSNHPKKQSALFFQAQSYMLAKKYPQAISKYKELLNSPEGKNLEDISENLRAQALYGIGLSLEFQDQLEEALQSYEKAIKGYPNPRVIEVKINRLKKRKRERNL